MSAAGRHNGLVVASHGRHCVVEADDGTRRICHPRGKKNTVVVGDRVQWLASQDEGSIEAVLPRRNLLFRQDELRTKSFAANLDQVLILLAAEPIPSEMQLARALIAAHDQHITPLIGLNKSDLGPPFERAWAQLAAYRQIGYPVLALALKPATADRLWPLEPALLQALHGKTTLLLGPSGAGKSSLINRLLPHAAVLTAELSQALGSGRHTTTSSTWYWLDQQHQSALIDSPGFQEFGLQQIAPTALAGLMPDLQPYLGHCRFYNCSHLHEPGCAVIAAVQAASAPITASPRVLDDKSGQSPHPICASRYHIYSNLHAELSQPQRY